MTSRPPVASWSISALGHVAAARRGQDRVERRFVGPARGCRRPRRSRHCRSRGARSRSRASSTSSCWRSMAITLPAMRLMHRRGVARAGADLEHLVAGPISRRLGSSARRCTAARWSARPRSAADGRRRRDAHSSALTNASRGTARKASRMCGSPIPRRFSCRSTIASRSPAKSVMVSTMVHLGPAKTRERGGRSA